MAARDGAVSYDQLHHFVASGVWDAAPLEAALLTKADEQVGGEDAWLIVDDTALPKKGRSSVGVAPQYAGALGKNANCQTLVSAARRELPPFGRRPLPAKPQLSEPHRHRQAAPAPMADHRRGRGPLRARSGRLGHVQQRRRGARHRARLRQRHPDPGNRGGRVASPALCAPAPGARRDIQGIRFGRRAPRHDQTLSIFEVEGTCSPILAELRQWVGRSSQKLTNNVPSGRSRTYFSDRSQVHRLTRQLFSSRTRTLLSKLSTIGMLAG